MLFDDPFIKTSEDIQISILFAYNKHAEDRRLPLRTLECTLKFCEMAYNSLSTPQNSSALEARTTFVP